MINLTNSIHLLLPLVSIILLTIAIIKSNNQLVLITLWLSAIGTMLHYQSSDNHILGSYFGYTHSSLYTINILTLLFSILYIIRHYKVSSGKGQQGLIVKSILSMLVIFFITTILINIWINALFIEHRLSRTPVLQIATFGHLSYCDYQYVFYVISKKNQLNYMCPNHFGLIPSMGTLNTIPDYIMQQLPITLQSKLANPSK